MYDKARPARNDARVFLLGAWVNPLNRQQAIMRILSWCAARQQRYAVTPNLDHCRMLQFNPALAAAYDKASLVLADGWPLVAASWLTPHPLSRRVTGADIIIPLCEASAALGFSVFLLGTTDEVLATASTKLKAQIPGLQIAGTYSPPFGFERDEAEIDRINAEITSANPHVVFAAFGSPKQELWMSENVAKLPIGAALGVGAGIDFIAGEQRRAPALLRWLALEWAWRAVTEPKRLLKRYALCLAAFPGLCRMHWREHVVLGSGVRPDAG